MYWNTGFFKNLFGLENWFYWRTYLDKTLAFLCGKPGLIGNPVKRKPDFFKSCLDVNLIFGKHVKKSICLKNGWIEETVWM